MGGGHGWLPGRGEQPPADCSWLCLDAPAAPRCRFLLMQGRFRKGAAQALPLWCLLISPPPDLPPAHGVPLPPTPPVQVVGAKSKNLAGLRGRLPDWISLPSSCTVGGARGPVPPAVLPACMPWPAFKPWPGSCQCAFFGGRTS